MSSGRYWFASAPPHKFRSHYTRIDLLTFVVGHFQKLIHRSRGALHPLMYFAAIIAAGLVVPCVSPKAQATEPQTNRWGAVVTVSGDSADRLRLEQLRGAPTTGFLVRSTSSLMDPGTSRRPGIRVILPSVFLIYNSQLPYGENDGALWAGKGVSFRAIAGAQATLAVLRITILPELVGYGNGAFEYTPQFVPPLPSSRNPYSSPWNVFPYSIDAPVRFGGVGRRRLSPGQSDITLHFPKVEFGFTTENEWWGPGIRSAIIMSDNAEGYPRLFVGTPGAVTSRVGTFDLRWMWGGLTESAYFDFDTTNNLRSISSIVGTWTPGFEPDLTIGFARSVFAPASGWGQAFARPFDVFASTGRPNGRSLNDPVRTSRDQLFSLFGRWVFPDHGFETYVEWARDEMPRSFRDFLLAPDNGQGYTFGLQWVRPVGSGRIRLQAEHTYLEQSPSFRNRQQGSFYTSRAVIQGYTNRGQVIGAGMGQGSSGQWFASDYLKGGWQFGAFGARTEFNNDASYLLLGAPPQDYCPHDVTLSPGIRVGAATPLGRLAVRFTRNFRINAFFQDNRSCFGYGRSVDVWDSNLTVGWTAGAW